MNKRPYIYRERPYDYRENQIRDASRTRQNKRQLVFTEKEYKIIENKMLECGAESFREYVCNCISNKKVTTEDLEKFKKSNDKKSKRKQICFNDEEIELIGMKMDELKCDNFNIFITTVALM